MLLHRRTRVLRTAAVARHTEDGPRAQVSLTHGKRVAEHHARKR
ncbi:hypothetical protein [Streptomyces roseolus]|nr:hypothetical protein [Streptomyces roseolus]GGR13427.1 hypothetical protein GCM10010282_02250 [Streptomyces roseolus]